MKRMNGKMAWYVMVVFCIGTLALWGCPKKSEISAVPETPRVEAPAAAATPQPAAEQAAQPEQKAEAAKPAVEVKERAAVADAGLRPVYFDFDKAFIETDAGAILKANAEWLKAHPQIKVRIEGNCDERGTTEYNQALGQRRAANAKKYLTDMGISGQRIVLISYGEEKSTCADHIESCWLKNRRDDFTVVSD
jgi:peptidoglycan-associated lipoprotein